MVNKDEYINVYTAVAVTSQTRADVQPIGCRLSPEMGKDRGEKGRVAKGAVRDGPP